MKIIRRTLIFLAMFTIFSGNTFADELKLACKYFLEDNGEEYIASIFLNTTNMTGSIRHSKFPLKGVSIVYEGEKTEVMDSDRMKNWAFDTIENQSAKLFTNGQVYWFTLVGDGTYTTAGFQYQIDRNNLSLGGSWVLGLIQILNGKCTIVENTTLI